METTSKAAIMLADDDEPTSELDKMLRLSQNNAMNINGLSRQMGLVIDMLNDNTQRIVALEDRLTSHERSVTISRAQQRRIKSEVMSRVNYLLGIEFEGGRVADSSIAVESRYRGPFIARLYSDAKKHSKMGEAYPETLKVDFDEVLDYISSWVPEVDGGVDGYMSYIDIRHEERAKRI